MDATPTNSPIIAAYLERTPGSAAAYARALNAFPSGITHDNRYLRPHPLSVTHARGARKWDVDGHVYVDYVGGHGALLLGHAHPAVTARVTEQLAKGSHFGANHELEVRWAELVRELMPSAELVRFTSSGTEATLMALRLARAVTGRTKILRVRGHFHGWHDHMAMGFQSHFDGSATPGVLDEVAAQIVLVDPNDEAGLIAALDASDGTIAAAILEPTGSGYGQVPLEPAFVATLRRETERRGIVLVFDEVVTGFRVARGGAQAALGVTPDLTTLAKILAGGLPGGAVVGRRDLLERLDFERARALGVEKIAHQGTYNANPVSAAAGLATLELVRDTDAIERAHAYAARLREGARAVLREESVGWLVYGQHTGLHLFLDADGHGRRPTGLRPSEVKARAATEIARKLRPAMLAQGVDLAPWPGGPASAAHDDDDLDVTLVALRAAVRALKEEGELG